MPGTRCSCPPSPPRRAGSARLDALVRAPAAHRLAEELADQLRLLIFSGELAEGAMLPKQDALMREFNVGLVTVREALRLLEVEGLLTIQRGNQGGAVVHRPRPHRFAYMLALSLQAGQVRLRDLLLTLKTLEPLLARLCAQAPDRATRILPALREIVAEQHRALDEPERFVALAVDFHSAMASITGISTMELVLTALEAIWSAQVEKMTRRTVRHDGLGARTARERALADHERIIAAIAAGDPAAAEDAARCHVADSYRAALRDRHDYELEIEIDASHLRP